MELVVLVVDIFSAISISLIINICGICIILIVCIDCRYGIIKGNVYHDVSKNKLKCRREVMIWEFNDIAFSSCFEFDQKRLK